MEGLRGDQIALIPQNPAEALDPVIRIKKQLIEAVTVHGKEKDRRQRHSMSGL